MNKILILFFIILIVLSGCATSTTQQKESDYINQTENNYSIKEDFNSYDEAIKYVRSEKIFIKDSVNTSKSSWIRGAEYYCLRGEDEGYAIFNLNGKEYIHKSLPSNVWEGFKREDSFGSYYNSNIKGKYTLILK